jgi:quercetin dioxygenase-like cupin family protein
MSQAREGRFSDSEEERPYEGVSRRKFSSDHSTFTAYEFAPGATFPIHRHSNEQVTLIQEGELEFTIDGTPKRMGPGEWSVIPGGIPHGITAGDEGARFVAIVTPRRQSDNDYEVLETS